MTHSEGLGGNPDPKLSLFLPLFLLILVSLLTALFLLVMRLPPPLFVLFRRLIILLSGCFLFLIIPLFNLIFVLVLIKAEALTCFEKCNSWKMFFKQVRG